VWIVAAQRDAAADLVRSVCSRVGAAFGWRATTLTALAHELARRRLAEEGLAVASSLAIEAVCARVVAEATPAELRRFAPVAETPGLPRALARTLGELRLALAPSADLPDDLAPLARLYDRALLDCGLVDRAGLLAAALAAAAASTEPLLLLDVQVTCELERRFIEALASGCDDVLATAPVGDDRSAARLASAIGAEPEELDGSGDDALARLQRWLFSEGAPPAGDPSDEVVVLSAPGEGGEAVEIARRVHEAAAGGVPFDRIAVLTRAPDLYRAHLEEALRRAGLPTWFDRGARRPDIGGRAFLALLACGAEGLSAPRFAEYLSLGQVPDATPGGGPPPPVPPSERHVAAEGEADPADPAPAAEPRADPADAASRPVYRGTLRVPRRWERLLVEAAVIGGLDRWRRRLGGLRAQQVARLVDLEEDDPYRGRIERTLAELDQLEAFALPLLEDLDALPASAPWGEWIELLGDLASRSLRYPDRVLALLGALQPMAGTGPVELSEVRLVLARRLTELVEHPAGRRFGRVFVGSPESARGRSFDVVFVPGLAERLFPRKLVEDPILLDSEGAMLATELETGEDRVAAERLRLRLAVGAATKQVVLSWSRLDAGQSRPRVPSFYGLEGVRATEGEIPGCEALEVRADQAGGARVAWPAPADPMAAIDAAEHDLALFARVRRRSQAEAAGTMRYLLTSNDFLARSLRSRYARWSMHKLTEFDGLVKPPAPAATLMERHRLDQRSFSATALQDFAACPYRFFLRTVVKLHPREEPEAIEYIDPLSRGTLVHETQYELLTELRGAGRLPVTPANLGDARARLDARLDSVAGRTEDDLAPAIPRVWKDEIEALRIDLREWLRLLSEEATWVPHRFELAFGLRNYGDGRDEHSQDDPVELDCGIRLRGSIDLVEQAASGDLRVTDFKTGRSRVAAGSVVDGGQALQPVLYALAAEKLFDDRVVREGRLWYCTSAGGFKSVAVQLDDKARRAASVLADTVGGRLAAADLPAAPRERACRWCDYSTVCGPHEELRTSSKARATLQDIVDLRSLR